MKFNDAPCLDCTSRQIGCHAKCEKYSKYKDEKQRTRRVIEDYIGEVFFKNEKWQRRHKPG